MLDVQSFVELAQWIDSLPYQQDCIHGEAPSNKTMISVSVASLARPNDKAVVERFVAKSMQRGIQNELSRANGLHPVIHWRFRPEHTTVCYPQVIEYCDDGPDFDPVEDKRCVMDRDWVRIASYCQFCFE